MIGTYAIPFLLPPGLNITIILFAWLIRWFKPFLSRFLVLMSVTTLYLFSTPFFAVYFATFFERYPALNINALPANIQAIVVIGPWKNIETDTLTPMNGQALSRLHYATWLYQKTKLPIYFVTRKPEHNLQTRDSLFMKNLLDMENDKIPVNYIQDASNDTWEDTRTIANKLEEAKIDKVYLITESWHMPQAIFGFERKKIKAIPAPTAFISDRFKITGPSAYLPHAEALSAVSVLFYESIRYHWYRLVK